MNFQPVQMNQKDIISGKNEASSTSEKSLATKSLVNLTPTSVPTSVATSAAASGVTNGRVVPVVYVKMPQREILPSVCRSGNIITALGSKISTAPSITSQPMLISSPSTANGSTPMTGTLTGTQSGFVTIQGSLRTIPQNAATTSSLTPSQPHIITLPKGSNTALLTNQQFLTLQSASGTGQVGSVPQQQYVTIQTPLVAKSQTNSANLNPGQVQPHYVTIRTPVLATSGSKNVTSGTQPQYVTIQAPVLQTGSSTAPTYMPVSAVGATATGTKSSVTYQVLKSSPKSRDQHLVYPLPVANLIPTSQPKMVLTPVSVVPKLPVNQSGTSISVSSCSDLVTTTSSISVAKTVASAASFTGVKGTVSPKVISNVRTLLQTKPIQPQSVLKESVQILQSTDVSVPTSLPIKINGTLLPTAVSVGSTTPSTNMTSGFINITIANGHIQPNAQTEASDFSSVVASKNTISVTNEANVIAETDNATIPEVNSVMSICDLKDHTSSTTLESPDFQGTTAMESESQEMGDDEISINSILKSNSVHYNDILNQKVSHLSHSDNSLGDTPKPMTSSEDGESMNENKNEATPQPSSPINLFCDEDDITLIKLSPTDEPTPSAKYTIRMPEDPDDDIKIELVKDDSNHPLDSKEVPEQALSRSEDKISHQATGHKPLLLKSKLLCGSKGHSLIKNPANLQSILVKSSKPAKLKPKSSSILKPQPPKLSSSNVDEADTSSKDASDIPKESCEPEIKIENLDSPLTPTSFEDFDAIAALDWKNGVGLLPGSNLKFRMNEFGLMEMVSDEEDKVKKEVDKDPQSPDSESLLLDEGSNSSVENKPDKDKKLAGLEDIFCCEVCRVYGLASEFLNSRFCTQACSALFTVKQAWQYKREQDLRALRLRRKRRRLEQRLAREKTDLDVKSDDVKTEFKKRKLELPDDMSDYENSLDDSRILDQNSVPQDDDGSLVRRKDRNEVASKNRPYKAAANFTWSKYLEMVQGRAAEMHHFKDPLHKYSRNGFKVGMKLEGIDVQHPSLFCVLSVAEVRGYRIRLHIDSYPDNYDFWVNADSPEIFPPRWCEKNSRRLTAPKGLASSFNWTLYLKQSKGVAAPKYLFGKNTGCLNHAFRVGMKVEAVDRQNSVLICVASVADVLDDRILIHFDSWDEMYDYWTDPSSPYIHPVGWCEKHGHALTPPNQYNDSSQFSWDRYLKETKSVAAPARAFKSQPRGRFVPGLRIEAVDKRVPHLIRVATIDDVDKHRIRIRFDGWPDDYSYWVDEDSPDIHFPGWCELTMHPLEPPLSEEDMRVLAKCGIPGCKGEGHIKGPKFSSHNSAQNCPYAPDNIRRESFLPNRLASCSDLSYLDESPVKDKKLGRPSGRKEWKRLLQDDDHLNERSGLADDDDEEASYKPSLIISMQQKLQSELERSVLDPGYQIETGPGRPACWAKHSQSLQSSLIDNVSNPSLWSVEEVAEFLSSISCLEGYGKWFKEQDIDGEALLLLTQNELVSNLSLKLGHAIMLYNCIVLLRQKCI